MRVLVVEDFALLAMGLELCLLEAGHTVIGPARTASEALYLAEMDRPDLALVDVQLEDGPTGVDLARALKQRLGVPCFLLTAQGGRARAAGDVALGILQKPYRPEAVLRAIELAAVLQSGRRPSALPAGLELTQPPDAAA